jgi:Domain of unknown function (DUF5916)
MLLPLLALLQTIAPGPPVYDGRQGQVAIRVPRVDAPVSLDAPLDGPPWDHAARLRGFSQYLPVDGVPSADSTVAMVFYSRDALYFGIRAYEAHGPIHATLADRDKITSDDYVQIFLDTSHDHRRAYVFGVNPFGIQADGILSEGIHSLASTGAPAIANRDTVNLSTDYTYQSRGHVTDFGYEVVVRIPFASVSFASGARQQWGVNVVRFVQHSGNEDTWAPVRLANTSFIGQFGTLDGMTDITRGLVLDLNPELTSHINGNPTSTGWRYSVAPLSPGGNVRWGVTDNLTLNGTIKPDFSQIEADVPQLQFDPRVALSYPEKRPFFFDGLEQFDTPNTLVYTRSIIQPNEAVKLTGELAGASVGFLSSVDESNESANGKDNPVFDILRLKKNIGGGSTFGIIATDREDGPWYNHVLGADTRFVFGGIYDVRLQAVGSSTRSDSIHAVAPLWDALFERNGRHWQLHYELFGVDSSFVDESGFIARTGIVTSTLDNSFTFYGSPGSFIQSYTFDFSPIQVWEYPQFWRAHRAEDIKWHFSNVFTFHGGWTGTASAFVENFGYDPALYQNYYIAEPTPRGIDTVHFTGTPNIPNLDIVTGFTTPRWKRFDASIQTVTGYDENFYEWSSAWILVVNSTIDWRPTDQARISLIYSQLQFVRRSDNSQVAVQRVPYIEAAYQLSRPIYLRFIGQYEASWVAALRDDGRTNDPILIRDPTTGVYQPQLKTTTNTVSGSWLFSYQPTPGTVFFVGYGSGYTEPYSFNFTGLRRTSDGFFVKATYLFHAGN